jgi:hypothetical protein
MNEQELFTSSAQDAYNPNIWPYGQVGGLNDGKQSLADRGGRL